MTTTRDLIQLAVERLQHDLKNQPSPSVRYDAHERRISVVSAFRFGTIPKVRIFAPCKDWLEIYYNVDRQSFESIRGLLSRCPKAKREQIRRFADEDIEAFRDDIFLCASAANEKNPDFYPKMKRRSFHYELSQREKHEVANMAVRLYVYLFDDIGKKSQKQWPPYVIKFSQTYPIHEGLLKNSDDLTGAVMRVVSKYFGFECSNRSWQTFVTDGPIKVERVRKLSPITPLNDAFLKEVFREFMN